MTASPAIAHFEISPSSELDDIFLYFEPRFKALHEPGSTVEALIAETDFDRLTQWFQAPERWEPVFWCEDTLRLETARGATRQEMFGAVFLLWAAEHCRDQANDDAFWPAISKILRGSKSYPVLFSAGHPSVACKNAIAAGARRLGLRNLIDRHGKQEYFDTLKLQFGFTYNGAVRRLAEWLDGFAPLPVRILNGEFPEFSDLKSESFADLWKALKQFRQRRRAEEYTRLAIQNSPWIRPAWTDDLLKAAAKGRSATSSGVTSPISPRYQARPMDERLFEPIFWWERGSTPRLLLRVNDERVSELLSECNIAEFQIDDKTAGRWTRQEGGDWRGERELDSSTRTKPNLRPRLLSIKNRDKIVKEFELREFGLQEALVVFDLVDGTLINEANMLDPNRDYALVCDGDLLCPVASETIRTKDGSYAYRVDRTCVNELKVLCEGALYWEPRISGKQASAPMQLTMQFPEKAVVEINSLSIVLIEGIPKDAVSARLCLGNVNCSLARQGEAWRTDYAVKITLALAVGEERVRVRVEGATVRTVTPKLNLRLRGIARRNREENGGMDWDVVHLDRPLERADGAGRARIFSGQLEPHLFEGFSYVGRIDSQGVKMQDLHGWGAPLCAGGKEQLVNSVEDHGLFKFIPHLFGRQTGQRLVWRSPTPVRKEHRIVAWFDLHQDPHCISTDEVICEQDEAVWKLPQFGEPIAMAITYDGMRRGSWFHSEHALKAIKTSATERLFATLRWLKIPVLNNAWQGAMRAAVQQNPAGFVRGWLGKEALSSSLCHRDAEDGIEVVVREFLWNYSDRNHWRAEDLAAALSTQPLHKEAESDVVALKRELTRLSNLYPSLAYNLARTRIGDKFDKHIRAVAIDLISLPEPMEIRRMFGMTASNCANLVGATQQEIEDAVSAYGDRLDGKAAPTKGQNFYLRRLGETVKGRQYIAASLLFRLQDRGAL